MPPRMIVLASGSAGRRELLRSEGVPFVALPSGIDEAPPSAVDSARPHAYARRLARGKALSVGGRLQAVPPPAAWARSPARRPLVLGCDTCIDVDGAILGKPGDVRQADDFLRRLAGREHRVVTGVCLLDAETGSVREASAESGVRVRALSRAERRAYLRTGEWSGAAGGYRVQGRGARLVERIRGSYSNVVGLPLEALYGILGEIDTSHNRDQASNRNQARGTTWR